jgi:hypothetical protein
LLAICKKLDEVVDRLGDEDCGALGCERLELSLLPFHLFGMSTLVDSMPRNSGSWTTTTPL